MDLSNLSDEELDAAIAEAEGGAAGGSYDFSSLSDDELDMAISEAEKSAGGWSLGSAAKQFGSGAVEGIAGLAALGIDNSPLGGVQAQLYNYLVDDEHELPTATDAVNEYLSPNLPEEEDNYRYSRRLGEFLGPDVATLGLGKVAKLPQVAKWAATNIVPSIFGGLGSQAAEDVTGDDTIAPVIGGIVGAGAPSIFKTTGRAARRMAGSTPQEIKGTASQILLESTDSNADDLARAIRNRPDDELGRLMSTAELTDDAGYAQLEKTLAASDEPARIYNQRALARQAVRDDLLDNLSETKGITREALGSKLIDRATDVEEQMGLEAKNLWEALPRSLELDATKQARRVSKIAKSRQGGLPLDRRVKILTDQFTGKGSKTTGMLQDIRSDALALGRDANITGHDSRVLGELVSQIDDAMGKGLKGDDLELWKLARDTTREQKETFARGTAGGSLLETKQIPSALKNAIKGDKESIKQLRNAIRNDPGLMEDVKRGMVDSIPRTGDDRITTSGMKRFLNSNEGALKELFGDSHYKSLNRILEDLQSEVKVSKQGYRASAGNSVTQQRQTVAGALEEIFNQGGRADTLSGRIVDTFTRKAGVRDEKALTDLLFKAAMDPEFALELASSPNNERMSSVIGRLLEGVPEITKSGVTGGVLGLNASNLANSPDRLAPSELPRSQGGQETQAQQSARSNVSPSRLPELQDRSRGLLGLVEESSSLPPAANPTPTGSETQSEFDLILDALRQVESGGDPSAVSHAGAKGPYQFMDATAQAYGLADPFDEETAREAARALLNDEYEALGSLELALAAYNAGRPAVLKAVEKAGSTDWEEVDDFLPRETRNYVPKIRKELSKLLEGV